MRLNEQGNPPHWVIIGLVSFGAVPCGQSGWPGVHTKVFKSDEHVEIISLKFCFSTISGWLFPPMD